VSDRSTDTSEFDRTLADDPSLKLLVEEPGRPPRVIHVPAGGRVRIGRAEDLEVTLDDTRASRVHALLIFDGRSVVVHDLESSNGSFVGTRRIEGHSKIGRGDVLYIGSTRIAIVVTKAAGPRPETHGPVVGPVASGRDVVAVDPATVALLVQVRRLGPSDMPVLILGESGSGKEVVARALHRYSLRASAPFIAINCGTLPDSIAESELFGHERGAFTGADARKMGLFDAAAGGTLLLDEVGELSPSSQTRLLRVLQDRVITRVGGVEPIPVDVRVLSATNRDIVADVASGRFREDLYFRLNGVTLAVPPLRSRPRDIMPIVERFLGESGRDVRLAENVVAVMQGYRWPGNVRELRNALECAMALSGGDEIRLEHLPASVRNGGASQASPEAASALRGQLDDVERRTILAALESTKWNQSKAARELGISRRTLIYKMARHGFRTGSTKGPG